MPDRTISWYDALKHWGCGEIVPFPADLARPPLGRDEVERLLDLERRLDARRDHRRPDHA
jgi:hypothetical protein